MIGFPPLKPTTCTVRAATAPYRRAPEYFEYDTQHTMQTLSSLETKKGCTRNAYVSSLVARLTPQRWHVKRMLFWSLCRRQTTAAKQRRRRRRRRRAGGGGYTRTHNTHNSTDIQSLTVCLDTRSARYHNVKLRFKRGGALQRFRTRSSKSYVLSSPPSLDRNKIHANASRHRKGASASRVTPTKRHHTTATGHHPLKSPKTFPYAG